MSDKNENNEQEIRKISAAAGGGLLGFAFAGPMGVIVGALLSSIAATIAFDKDIK